eukprot:15396585-Heterocapsa_arctica.AAC.1
MPGWRAQERRGLSDGQVIMALHMYHSLSTVIENILTDRDLCRERFGIDDVTDYCMRFEYQDRGTIHVHVVAWVKLSAGAFTDAASRLCGQTGKRHSSRLVSFLEAAFRASVDVQCGHGEHCLL